MCESEGALFAVVLWLERFFSAGPDATDDVLSAVMHAHVEGEKLTTTTFEPTLPLRRRRTWLL